MIYNKALHAGSIRLSRFFPKGKATKNSAKLLAGEQGVMFTGAFRHIIGGKEYEKADDSV
ncbi:hypothetical protein LVQ34_003544 [Escherichia coli]|jgi:hypothetical protein|nr:hypothetical protein [Escherichia coli]EIQ9904909.1 hypothetical protein [Escherichia coli]